MIINSAVLHVTLVIVHIVRKKIGYRKKSLILEVVDLRKRTLLYCAGENGAFGVRVNGVETQQNLAHT
jgi:hypothetical protein